MGLCDIADIREILGRHGFHFSKSLGQNFLTAAWVPEAIAEACGVDGESDALEVGPGMGCLTEQLSKRARRVCAIELDRALFPVLEETLSGCANVNIVQGDVLKVDLKQLCMQQFGEQARIHACANLPYYITTPAITVLLQSGLFESVTVMIQKEVAQRICAAPGTSDYSAFSIFVRYYADAEIAINVPRGCFVPQPKVDSAVVYMKLRGAPPVDIADEALFFSMVRSAFHQRRKTLVNALGGALGSSLGKPGIQALVADCGFDMRIRGERLSLEDFAVLSNLAHERLLQSKQ